MEWGLLPDVRTLAPDCLTAFFYSLLQQRGAGTELTGYALIRPTCYTARMSILYIVATPIGNLSDASGRSIEVLGVVDGILAEDTRRTRKLLDRYDLRTSLTSLHQHNEASRIPRVVERLDAGETLALVSDAGTPLLSDPGERLVGAVLDAGHTVTPVPGPSAMSGPARPDRTAAGGTGTPPRPRWNICGGRESWPSVTGRGSRNPMT